MQEKHKGLKFNPIYGSLNRRVAFYILLFSSFLTLILTAFQLYRNYSFSVEEVESNIDTISIQAVPVLAQALWNIDDVLLKIVLEGVTQLPSIESATIHDPQGDLHLQIGTKLAKYAETKIFNLDYRFLDTPRSMGTLTITAELDSVRENIQRQAFTILLSQGLKTFLVSLFIMFLLYQLIGRHLSKIVDSIHLYSTRKNDSTANSLSLITLNRPNREDELSILVTTLNNAYSVAEKAQNKIKLEIDARQSAEKTLKEEHKRLIAVLDSLSEALIELDKRSTILWCNKAACRMLEVACKEDVTGSYLSDLIKFHFGSERDQEMLLNPSTALEKQSEAIYHGYASVGNTNPKPVIIKVTPLRLETRQPGYAILVSDKLDRKEYEKINYYATRDFLTGLPNRYRFDKLLESAVLELNIDHKLNRSLAFIDIDALKPVNDICGHATGDKLLLDFAKIVTEFTKNHGVAARIGGDEFVILFSLSISESKIRLLALIKALETLRVPKTALSISASIGLTKIVVEDDPADALSRADKACYKIKYAGGAGVEIAALTSPVAAKGKWQEDYDLIRKVEAAIANDNFLLFGQPIVAIQNELVSQNRIEILIRLRDKNTLKLPDSFFPIAERYRFGIKIDLWVINHVRHLICSGKLALQKLNINLSLYSLNNTEIHRAVEKLMNDIGSEWDICFELTESYIVNDFVKARSFAYMAHNMNAKFAIDDFGKGYASYGMISNFPVDYIKIDGSLVSKIVDDPKKRAIVSSIQTIAESMNAQTVAEHVQDQAAMDILSEIGVHFAQSYFTGRPAPLKMNT